MSSPKAKLLQAARAYSAACDAWNATGGLPFEERWRSTAAFGEVKRTREALAEAARLFAKGS